MANAPGPGSPRRALDTAPYRRSAMPNPRICSIDGCGKPQSSRGYCNPHYQRWVRHGDPLKGTQAKSVRGTIQKYFFETVLRYDADNCLLWPFSKTPHGYGSIKRNGRQHGVHRLVCESFWGPPPSERHDAAHNCGIPSCCNWKHLAWKTRIENKADELRHGTRRRGDRHGRSRLSSEEVIRIRSLAASNHLPQTKIASMFKITQQQVCRIVLRKRWSHI